MLIQHKAYGGYKIAKKILIATEQATEEGIQKCHDKASHHRASNGAHSDGAEYTYKVIKDADTAHGLRRPHTQCR